MSDAGFIDTFTVAIEGFSAFERQALASFFRLAARVRPPSAWSMSPAWPTS